MTVPLWAVEASGSFTLLRRFSTEGRNPDQAAASFPLQLLGQQSRERHPGRPAWWGLERRAAPRGSDRRSVGTTLPSQSPQLLLLLKELSREWEVAEQCG